MLTVIPNPAFDAANRGDQSAARFEDEAATQSSPIAPPLFRQTAVLILGMHRSGTSLLSSLVQSLGISLGDRLIPGDAHNRLGYFEDRECVEIHERMLAALGQPWWLEKGMLPFPNEWWCHQEIRPLVEELEAWIDKRRLSQGQVWAVKDPRTTRFLPLWQELLLKRGILPRYLLAARDPAEVVASQVTRDKVPAERVYRTWLRYNMEALLHAGPELAGVFIYSQWFSTGTVQLQRLAAVLGLSVDDDECDAILGRLVRSELHRQRGGAASPPCWASHLYRGLKSLAEERDLASVPGLAAEAEYFDALLRHGEEPSIAGALAAVLPATNGVPEALKLADRLRGEGARVVLGVAADAAATTTASGVAVVAREINGPPLLGGHRTRAAYDLWRWLRKRQYAAVHIEGGEGLAAHCLDARRHGLPDKNGPIHVHYFVRPPWLEEDGHLHLHSFAEAEALCLERRILSDAKCRLSAHPTLLALLRNWAADEPTFSSDSIPSRSEPLVSICIAHHNRPAMLSDCLTRVRAQTYRKLEVILVDDASTHPAARIFVDSLKEELQAEGWTLVRRENRHLGAAREAAVRAATGDYLFILDDDNLLMPDSVARAVQIAQRTNADIVTSVMALFDGPAGTDPTWPDHLRVFPGGAPLLGLFENTFGDANALVRRSCLKELDGFAEGGRAEGWEFLAKAALRGYRLEHCLTPLSWYRDGAARMAPSGNWWSDYRHALRAYETVMPPALRELPALAGALWRRANEAGERTQNLTAELAQRGAEVACFREMLAERDVQIKSLTRAAAEREATLEAQIDTLTSEGARKETALHEISDLLEANLAARRSLQKQLDAMLASTFWRVTGPARKILAAMPPGLKRQARRSARLFYWLLTPHRTRWRIAYLRSRRGSLPALSVAAVKPPTIEEPPTKPC